MHLLAWPAAVSAGRVLVGDKALNLALLARRGLPVPPGLVLPAPAYDHFMATTGLDQVAARLAGSADPNDDDLADLRSRIERAPLPAVTRDALTKAIDYPAFAGGSLAVRSSAIGEDGARASFAGIYASFLNV